MKRIALAILLSFLCCALGAAEPQLMPGVKLMVGDQPISGEVGHLVPCVVDWNGDGKKDLLVGQFGNGSIRVYLNEGTDAAPLFKTSTLLEAGGKPIKLDAG